MCGCFLLNTTLQIMPTRLRNCNVPGQACIDGGTGRALRFSGRGGLQSLEGPEEVGQTGSENWCGPKGQMQPVLGREGVGDLPGKGCRRG